CTRSTWGAGSLPRLWGLVGAVRLDGVDAFRGHGGTGRQDAVRSGGIGGENGDRVGERADRSLPLGGELRVPDQPAGADMQAHEDLLDLPDGRGTVLTAAAIEHSVDGRALPPLRLRV